mmetsp:Transcript_41998/g.105353  ORF Transcript_41998/g.105353 Transcript_41998/m.105353 type:complete len:292 (-) Transcript_41998:771-1646(-)
MGAALKGHVHPVPSKALQAQEHPVDGLVRVVLHPHALAFLLAQLWSGLAVAALRPTGRCLLVHDLRLSRRGGFTPGGRGRVVARRACRRPLAPLPRQDILQPEAPKAANHGGRVAAAGRLAAGRCAAVGRLAPQLLQREAVAPRAGLLRCPADPLALGLSLIARRRRFLLLSLLLPFRLALLLNQHAHLQLAQRPRGAAHGEVQLPGLELAVHRQLVQEAQRRVGPAHQHVAPHVGVHRARRKASQRGHEGRHPGHVLRQLLHDRRRLTAALRMLLLRVQKEVLPSLAQMR